MDDTLKKQNPGPLEEKRWKTPEALVPRPSPQSTSSTFGRTPNFEPRRAAGVPTAFAVRRRSPLLPHPLRPETAIRDWFASPAMTEGFEQKSLRQWKRRHPGHRSFTVLRHPLLRAHAVFRRKIVLGEAQDRRRILINGFPPSCSRRRALRDG